MKKLAILSALTLALGFTACDDNDIIEIPQNPEQVIFEAENLTVTPCEEAAVIDVKSYYDSGELIKMATVAVENLPEGYKLDFAMEISKDESFANAIDLPVTLNEENSLVVDASVLQNVYYTKISKGPKEKTLYSRFAAYAVKESSKVRIGDPATFYGAATLKVTPLPSDLFIEDAYYLIGTACDWTMTQAIKLEHPENVSPYDDPVFTGVFNVSEGWWWKIVPESTYVTGDWVDAPNAAFGVEDNGDDSLAGVLAAKTETFDPGAGCLNVVGPHMLKINMEEMTYEFTLAIECLYTPGGSNGWNQGASQTLGTVDYLNYFGAARLDGEFKFTSAPNWDGINYGAADEAGKLSTDGGAGNLSVPAAGLYWCTVSLAELTYTTAQINSIGVIGDATPGGWDNSTELTPSDDMLTWSGKVTFGGGEFKFRANNAWDINLGGAADLLVPGGSNMPSPGAGEYNVVLDLTKFPYTCTISK